MSLVTVPFGKKVLRQVLTGQEVVVGRKGKSGPDLFGGCALGSGQDHGDDGADAEGRHDQVVSGRGCLDLKVVVKLFY